MNLLEQYNTAIKHGEIEDDPLQRAVIPVLQATALALNVVRSWFYFGLRKKNISGVYIYGPVGLGKTYLMDLFYKCIELKNKQRFHFHHFMQYIDSQLRLYQGQRDPIKKIAKAFARRVHVLCLDEFFVTDVADAAILDMLLRSLFSHGVVLVVTSNTKMDDLYLNGVHRQQFLPAIAALKQHCTAVWLHDGHDYRLNLESVTQKYFYPLNESANLSLAKVFKDNTQQQQTTSTICVQKRLIDCIASSKNVVWFAFEVLCNIPRCSRDYLEIADRYRTVLISDVPKLSADDTLNVVLLMHLIDVFYDRGIELIVSAAVPLDQLYVTGPMINGFQRTYSRLQEMQSVDFLKRHPRWTGESACN